MKNYLSVSDLSQKELDRIVDRAGTFAASAQSAPTSASGLALANLFFAPSTRTTAVLSIAMQRLGGLVINMSGDTAAPIRGEGEYDIVRSAFAMVDIIAIRSNDSRTLELLHKSPVPVINAMGGADEHPLAAIWYLFTLRTLFGTLNHLKIGFYGQTRYCRPYLAFQKLISQYCRAIYEDSILKEMATPSEVVAMIRDRGCVHEQGSLRDFLGEVDLLCIADGVFPKGADETLVSNYLQRFRPLEVKDLSGYKGKFEVMMPRLMPDGRTTVSEALDFDERNIHDVFFPCAIVSTMALLTHLLDSGLGT